MSSRRGSNSRQYERNAWFKPLVHAAAGARSAAILPFEWLERLRESKPGSVLLSDDIVFSPRGCVRIAFGPAPFFNFWVRFAKMRSPADDWVGTGVCKLSSSLCCYDWLSTSVVLLICLTWVFILCALTVLSFWSTVSWLTSVFDRVTHYLLIVPRTVWKALCVF